MSNLIVAALFTKTGGAPATGLTLSEITLKLTAVNKATAAQTVIWTTQNPTLELTSIGQYVARYASADMATYVYSAEAYYSGATVLDSAYGYGSVAGAEANLISILGTALTETVAGYLAAAFKKLFDVVTPVFTAASVNQTGDSFARLGTPAGASVSADVLDLHGDVADVHTDVADVHTDIAALSLAWTGAAVATSVASGAITQIRGDVWNIAMTGLADSTGATGFDFSIKENDADADADALVHIRLSVPAVPASDGLDRLNKAAPSPADLAAGSITNMSTTAKTIHLDADKTAQLAAVSGLVYDLQYLYAATTGPVTASKGAFNITADVTRATA